MLKEIKNKVEKNKNEVLFLLEQGVLTWGEFFSQVENLLNGLNLKKQERVAIYSGNSWRWMLADFSIMYSSAISVPIHSTSSLDQISYILNDAEVETIFVGNQEQYNNIVNLWRASELKTLKRIVVLNETELNNFFKKEVRFDNVELIVEDVYSLMKKGRFKKNSENYKPVFDPAYLMKLPQNLDIFTLIYTSGTTGQPKGVILDYGNLNAQLKAHDLRISVSEKDLSLSFLPLSHIFERTWVLYLLHKNAKNYFLSNPNKVKEALQKVKPTLMCVVPRFLEKIYTHIIEESKGIKKHILQFFVNLSPNNPLNALGRLLVFSKIKKALGGNIRMMPCGGAKLNADIGRLFSKVFDLRVGYGMTETAATVSCWDKTQSYHFNSIGHIMPFVDVKIDPDTSEILVKGDIVMKGYYNLPEETAKTFDENGYLKTGDKGEIVNGELFITGRIKDLMKTSTGKYIAPQKLEEKFSKDKLFEQIAIIADGKKYVSALIVPHLEVLEQYAKKIGIAYQDARELLQNVEIISFVQEKIDKLQEGLASFEKVKSFALLSEAFSIKAGELTPTLKLRRNVILENYKELIESLYSDRVALS